MEVVGHPYLKGVQCREGGAVFILAVRAHLGHWTFGFPISQWLPPRVTARRVRAGPGVIRAGPDVTPRRSPLLRT